MKCEICKEKYAQDSWVLGGIYDDNVIRLYNSCGDLYNDIPEYIPDKQVYKYVSKKYNLKMYKLSK